MERARSRNTRRDPSGGGTLALRMMEIEDQREEPDWGEFEWMADEEGQGEEVEQLALRKALLKNLFTPNIEAFLEGLDGELKVAHTVDPQQALKCLPLWKPAIEAELDSP